MARSAAFFDLDKTVIAKASTLAFGRPFYEGGLLSRRAGLRSAYVQFVYLLNGLNEEQMNRLRDNMSGLVAGWDVDQVRQIVAETLHDLIGPLIYAEAAALIAEHRAAGRDIILVSSSGDEVVRPIGELLGVDQVIATRMVIEDGQYTGGIEFYAAGENKAIAINELAEHEGYDLQECYAYSDSITDVPMLAAVGHAVAVNPDRALRRIAIQRDWPVLVFRRPVPRPRHRHSHVMVGIGVGVVAFAGVMWYRNYRGKQISTRQ